MHRLPHPLDTYTCPICGHKVLAKRLTHITCLCLPKTPTLMDSDRQVRSIKSAIHSFGPRTT